MNNNIINFKNSIERLKNTKKKKKNNKKIDKYIKKYLVQFIDWKTYIVSIRAANKKEAEQKTKDYWEAGDFLADKPEECLFEIVRVDDEDANEKA